MSLTLNHKESWQEPIPQEGDFDKFNSSSHPLIFSLVRTQIPHEAPLCLLYNGLVASYTCSGLLANRWRITLSQLECWGSGCSYMSVCLLRAPTSADMASWHGCGSHTQVYTRITFNTKLSLDCGFRQPFCNVFASLMGTGCNWLPFQAMHWDNIVINQPMLLPTPQPRQEMIGSS